MPLPIGPVLGILSDNLKRRGSVLPLSRGKSTGWSKGLDLPHGGETVLYTGQMYQLIPSIDAMASQMALFENSEITKLFGLGRFANRFINLSFFMSLGASQEMRRMNDQVLRSITAMLQKAGVTFGYLYDKDLYSGALVYDGGMDDSFALHARRVFKTFREFGVRRIITVDPHTTNILREVYPRFVDGFDLEVKNYLEILVEQGLPVIQKQDSEWVIHDSCVYARYERMIEQPRRLLADAGVAIREPELAGRSTYCCGGPAESLFPTKAHEIAENRIDQLKEMGQAIVTMCPICQVNLTKAAKGSCRIADISEILSAAYLP